jgi:hypothetical protein
VVLPLRRNAFSPAVLVVGFALLVVLPLAVAVAIAVTVLGAGSTVGGVAVGLVVPLALFAFALGVARPLVAGRKIHIVLRADALVLADKGLFRSAEAIPRHAVREAHIGPAVAGWLAARDPADEVGLAPDDEPVDLLLVFDELVVLDHARRKASRPKGEHRSALPRPDQPVGHLWVPLADPDGASRALAAWLSTPPVPAPAGTPPPDLG